MHQRTLKPNPKRIDEELVCIDALKYALEVQFGCEVGTPERTPTGRDPPDFWLQIDGNRMPVEITSITERQSYRSHARRMANQIQEDARKCEILSGTYGLVIRRYPKIPKPSKKRSTGVFSIAKQYIRETANVATADEVILVNDSGGTIALKKFSDQKAGIGEMHTVVEYEDETVEKVSRLIHLACLAKNAKLLKNGCQPIDAILVLYDAYGFAEIEDARAAAVAVDVTREFHSVFWAASFTKRENRSYPTEHGRYGVFLSSTIPEWLA